MASNWRTVYSYPDVQVLSATLAIDVETVGVVTTPGEVFFEYQFPREEWQGGSGPFVAAALDPIANEVESWLAYTSGGVGSVADLSYVQDVDASGLLTAFLDFTIRVPSPSTDRPGPFTASVRVPWKLAAG